MTVELSHPSLILDHLIHENPYQNRCQINKNTAMVAKHNISERLSMEAAEVFFTDVQPFIMIAKANPNISAAMPDRSINIRY